MKLGGMAAEQRVHCSRIEALEDVANGGVRGSESPFQAEDGVEPGALLIDEGGDAAIRVGAGHDCENGEQQDMRQLAQLALRSAWIGNVCQQLQQRQKRDHGNL